MGVWPCFVVDRPEGTALMHVGVKLPNWGPLATRRSLRDVAVAAEQRGFGSLWVSEHVVMPAGDLGAYPYSADAKPPFDSESPFLDPFASLAFVAAVTERVQLGSGVVVLPLRHPIMAAKQAASVDVLSDGRLLLGVGSGWMADEFALLGQEFTDRGQRTDLGIRTMRACWGESPRLPGTGTRVGITPRPYAESQLPIIVGGHSAPARRRAARYGDGWYASNVTVPEFAAQVAQVQATVAEDRPGARLLLGVRPGYVTADQAAPVTAALTQAGADFVVLDAAFEDMTPAGAVRWVEQVADSLREFGPVDGPLRTHRHWSAEDGWGAQDR